MPRRVIPDPVDQELQRPQLIHRLQERFHAPVVCVVAGAGFGDRFESDFPVIQRP